MGDIISDIKVNYNRFTKLKRRVADEVIKNPKEVIYMSITELAEKCGVGESTVFRFCQDIDCSGYQEFRVALASQMAITEEAPNEEVSGVQAIAESVCTRLEETLHETLALLQGDKIKKAVKWLSDAGRIAFFGVGSSSVAAFSGYNRFSRVIPKAVTAFDTHSQMVIASLLEAGDVAFFISYSGSTKEIVNMAKQAKKRGAKVISITRFTKSPLTSYSDMVLLCGSNERVLQGNATSSEVGQLLLLEILYLEFCNENAEVTRQNLQCVAEALYEKMY